MVSLAVKEALKETGDAVATTYASEQSAMVDYSGTGW